MSLLYRFWEEIKDFLFPRACLGCDRLHTWLCPECQKKLVLLNFYKCPHCGSSVLNGHLCSVCSFPTTQGNYLDGLVVTTDYEQPLLKTALHYFKYHYVRDLAYPLGQILLKQAKKFIDNTVNWTIVPIPLSPARKRWRGFNQSELLAQHLLPFFAPEIENTYLVKVKNTPEQAKLKAQKRLDNLKDVFRCSSKASAKISKNVILVDDVLTTGTTLNEAAKCLKQNGVVQVIGLVLAHSY